MRDLASFVMKGPKQATMVAVFCTGMPMLFWLGAAIVGLVTLRRGIGAGLGVLAWAILPALGWWYTSQYLVAAVVLLITVAMASVLRVSTSWQASFAAGVLVSIIIGTLVPWLAPEQVDLGISWFERFFQQLADNGQIEYTEEVTASFRILAIASIAASFYGLSIGSVCLARYWQSALYNPDGWKQEFHSMRLSPSWLAAAVLTQVMTQSIGIDSTLVFVILTIPILICGIALIHGVIAKKNLGGQWLIVFYLILAATFPTLLMMVVVFALLDSVIDFRGKIDRVADSSDEP